MYLYQRRAAKQGDIKVGFLVRLTHKQDFKKVCLAYYISFITHKYTWAVKRKGSPQAGY